MYGKLSAFLSISPLCLAVLVTMPDEKTIAEHLKKMGLNEFNQSAQLSQSLAGNQLSACDVEMDVEIALYRYCSHINGFHAASKIANRKSEILEALLQDNPDALRELAALKLYFPNK